MMIDCFKRARKCLIFPIFNAIISLIFGTLIGYYVFKPWQGALLGALVGLGIGLVIEIGLFRFNAESWLYRRRVLIAILVECLLAVFVVGPFAFAVVETRAHPHEICCMTPFDLGAESYEEFRVESDPGLIISGWYAPPAGGKDALVVLLHGGDGDRLGTAWHAEVLIAAGYGVVMYDQRGLGESGGEITTFGWDDAADLAAVLDWVAEQKSISRDRIGVAGLSLGGQIAINAAAEDPDWVHPLWVEGTGAQGIKDFPPAMNLGERFATLINHLVLRMVELRIGHRAPPPFVEILPGLQGVPIAFVYGGAEPFEVRVANVYRSVAPESASFWVIENAHHVGGLSAAPDEYRENLLAFFDMKLR